MLFTEDEENFPGIKTFEHNADKKEIIVRFIYEIQTKYTGKADVIVQKWTEDNFESIKEWLVNEQIPTWDILLKSIEHKKDKKYCLLKKHLNAYVAKNTFDYFIHKDLKGFLSRELDFYIKSEIMHLDDLDTTNEQRVETYLAKVRAVKRVGHIIIDFLAQIENFQKKLWLKKKFVIETNWCITLDRIDERFYPEIMANKAQIQEWIDMYAVDEIKGDMLTEGFTNPPTAEFLKQNDKLIVDTKHFSSDFKERLIASIDNLDEQTGGLMINSDNYQALNLLHHRYNGKVKGIYADPPYNTNASEILYKNGYKDSSWNTLLTDRIVLSKSFLQKKGIICYTIDDTELINLINILDIEYGYENRLAFVPIRNNPSGRSTVKGFSINHEYALFYSVSDDSVLGRMPHSDIQKQRYDLKDEKGYFEWENFRKNGTDSDRKDRPKQYYPIVLNPETMSIRIPSISWNGNGYDILENISENEIMLYPDNEGVQKVWKFGVERTTNDINELLVKKAKNGYEIYRKKYINDEGSLPRTWWDKPSYSARDNGTRALNQLFGSEKVFDFPKAPEAVEDCIRVINVSDNDLILDIFAGSGTTGNAIINLNRFDGNNRAYILLEMGAYFDKATTPRIKKAVYSSDWKDGKPQNRNTGVSHIMKYMKLESYEDALSNITLDDEKHGLASLFGDDYLINYMLDIEAEGSLLNLDAFRTPFEYKLKVTENNETKEKNVDVVETFNYLIGLTVQTASAITYFNAVKDENGEYEGAVRLIKDIGGTYGFKQIEGTTPDGKRVLVIWRTISDNLIESNAALDAYFSKHRINPQDREYDIIYVNGDNNLQNISTAEDTFKVQMTELEFKKRMFEEE